MSIKSVVTHESIRSPKSLARDVFRPVIARSTAVRSAPVSGCSKVSPMSSMAAPEGEHSCLSDAWASALLSAAGSIADATCGRYARRTSTNRESRSSPRAAARTAQTAVSAGGASAGAASALGVLKCGSNVGRRVRPFVDTSLRRAEKIRLIEVEGTLVHRGGLVRSCGQQCHRHEGLVWTPQRAAEE